MNHPKPATCSRRRFLRIAAIHGAAFAMGGSRLIAASTARPLRWQGIALGAVASIQVYGDEATGRGMLRECRAEISRLERIFSLYDETSALAGLNRSGRLENAPPELVDVLALAHRGSELTDGRFDVSIHPLCELLANTNPTDLDAPVVRNTRRLVDYRRIECAGATVRLEIPGMRLTLNGVAQGYITDCVVELLRQRGYRCMLVDVGEKRALGAHPDGRPWRIGLESPFDRSELVDVLELENRAMATSGGYGEIYGGSAKRHHLIDARTGESRPAFASVSVLAPDAATADLLSTCLAVSPPEQAPEILAAFPGTEAHVVEGQGTVRQIRATERHAKSAR